MFSVALVLCIGCSPDPSEVAPDNDEGAGDAGMPKVDGGTPSLGREDTDALCSDGISNDGDRFIDCDDFDCSRNSAVTVCEPQADSPETNCTDGISNDGDRFVDCDDFDCKYHLVCRYSDLRKQVTTPNATTCLSAAVFSRNLAIAGGMIQGGTAYPAVFRAQGNNATIEILGLPAISAVPVRGQTWGDPLVRIRVIRNESLSSTSGKINGQSADLCWWNSNNSSFACPSEFLQLVRGDYFENVPVDGAWQSCTGYTYASYSFNSSGLGVRVIAPSL